MAPPLAALPPLMPIAWFWLSRLWLTVSVPPERLATAPPRPTPPGAPMAWLSDRTSRSRVRVLAVFRMPPPLPGDPITLPSRIVSPAMVTVAPPLMLKIRLCWLPLTASRSAPGPSMVRASVMLNWPLVRGIVPFSPSAKAVVSAPGWALASRTAWRNEPSPLSARFRTVKVLGKARPSSSSRRGTNLRRDDRRFPLVDVANQVDNMRLSPRSAIEGRDIVPGAQTERRGGAGPVGGLLGGKDPTGRLV